MSIRQNYNFDKYFTSAMPEPGGPGGQGGHWPPNIWQISLPYSNRGGRIIPTYYTTGSTPNVFHLPASLHIRAKAFSKLQSHIFILVRF